MVIDGSDDYSQHRSLLFRTKQYEVSTPLTCSLIRRVASCRMRGLNSVRLEGGQNFQLLSNLLRVRGKPNRDISTYYYAPSTSTSSDVIDKDFLNLHFEDDFPCLETDLKFSSLSRNESIPKNCTYATGEAISVLVGELHDWYHSSAPHGVHLSLAAFGVNLCEPVHWMQDSEQKMYLEEPLRRMLPYLSVLNLKDNYVGPRGLETLASAILDPGLLAPHLKVLNLANTALLGLNVQRGRICGNVDLKPFRFFLRKVLTGTKCILQYLDISANMLGGAYICKQSTISVGSKQDEYIVKPYSNMLVLESCYGNLLLEDISYCISCNRSLVTLSILDNR